MGEDHIISVPYRRSWQLFLLDDGKTISRAQEQASEEIDIVQWRSLMT